MYVIHTHPLIPYIELLWTNRGFHADENAEAALIAAARKEVAHLEHVGRPLLPYQRERREAYEYKKQSPTDHIKNLERYLLLAPSLIPKDVSLHAFCIRHPDLQPSNVIVSTSPVSGRMEIVSILDWQHAAILPTFLLAGIPSRLHTTMTRTTTRIRRLSLHLRCRKPRIR